MKDDFYPGPLSRRDALALLGLGAPMGLLTSAWQRAGGPAPAPAYPKGAIIRTLLKDLAPDRLGTGATLIHEHLSIGQTSWGPPRPTWQFTDDVRLMTEEVNAMPDGRVSCIVDAGNAGLGRNIGRLRDIAMHSKVHIVACGGLRLKGDFPPDIAQKTEDSDAGQLRGEVHAAGLVYGESGEPGCERRGG